MSKLTRIANQLEILANESDAMDATIDVGDDRFPLTGPEDMFKRILSSTSKDLSVMLYTIEDYDKGIDRNYIGGVDLEIVSPLVNQGPEVWHWPLKGGVGGNSQYRDGVNVYEPRYRNLRDAALISLQTNNGELISLARQGTGNDKKKGIHQFIVKVRDFYDNPDYDTAEGTARAWWMGQLSQLKVQTEPVKWRGGDDPMNW